MVASLSFDSSHSTMQKNLVLLSLSFLLLTIFGDGGEHKMGRISRYWPFKTYFWRSLVMVASLRWEESHVTDPSRLTSDDPWWCWRACDGKNLELLTLQDLLLTILGDGGEPAMGRISHYWPFKNYFWRSLVMVAGLRWEESLITDPSRLPLAILGDGGEPEMRRILRYWPFKTFRVTDPSRLTSGDPWWRWRAWAAKTLALLTLQDSRLTFDDPWWWWRAWDGKNLALLTLQDLLLTILGDGWEPEMGRISRYWPFKTDFWRSLVMVASLRWEEFRFTDPSRLTALLAIPGDVGEPEMGRILRYWPFMTYFWRSLVMVASLRWEESHVTDPSRLTSGNPWWWWRAWDEKNLALLTLQDFLLTILGDVASLIREESRITDPSRLPSDDPWWCGEPEMGRISRYWPFKTYFWRSLVMVASLLWEEYRVTDPLRLTSGHSWWWWRDRARILWYKQIWYYCLFNFLLRYFGSSEDP